MLACKEKAIRLLGFNCLTIINLLTTLIIITTTTKLANSTTFIENYIIGTPKVICEENDVSLDIITHKPFEGNIFVKGRAKDATCRQSFANQAGLNTSNGYTLPLGHCGMQRLRSANPRGINFAITVIVSFHPNGFITKNDRAFHVRCFYMEPDEIVTNNFEVSQLPTHELNDALTMPTCEYSVHSNSIDGPLLSYTSVGETVYHVWECKGTEMGLLIKKCFVTDGDGEDHAVVDYDGCTLDLSLLSQITYEENSMRAYAQSQAFKYADSNQIYFTCQIRLCQKQMDLCDGITPPKCSKTKKISPKFVKENDEELLELSASKNSQPIETLKKNKELLKLAESKTSPSNEDEAEEEEADIGNSTQKAKQQRKKRNVVENNRIRNDFIQQKKQQQQNMEMDVATPEMLIFDRDERKKIQKQQEQQLLLNINNNKNNFSKRKNHHEFLNFHENFVEKFCFEKWQFFYSIPLIGLMLIFITSLLTIAFYKKNFGAKNEFLNYRRKMHF